MSEKKAFSNRKRKLLGGFFLIFLVLLWQAVSIFIRKDYLVPGPWQVLQSVWQNRAELFLRHLPATLSVMGIGLFCAVVLGTGLALFMDIHSGAEKALYPLLTFTQTVPVMCLAPVLVLWCGYTILMRVIVVILVTFFTITVNCFDGLRSVNRNRTELLVTYGAGWIQQMRLLRIPTALPYLLTALKIALPWSAIGAVISEWLGAPSGMGVFGKTAMMGLDAAGLLAPFFILSVIVLLINQLIGGICEKINRKYGI